MSNNPENQRHDPTQNDNVGGGTAFFERTRTAYGSSKLATQHAKVDLRDGASAAGDRIRRRLFPDPKPSHRARTNAGSGSARSGPYSRPASSGGNDDSGLPVLMHDTTITLKTDYEVIVAIRTYLQREHPSSNKSFSWLYASRHGAFAKLAFRKNMHSCIRALNKKYRGHTGWVGPGVFTCGAQVIGSVIYRLMARQHHVLICDFDINHEYRDPNATLNDKHSHEMFFKMDPRDMQILIETLVINADDWYSSGLSGVKLNEHAIARLQGVCEHYLRDHRD